MRRASARLYRRATRVAALAAVVTLACMPRADADSDAAAHTDNGPAATLRDGALHTIPLAQPTAFSTLHPGGSLAPWAPVGIAIGKRHTLYELVDDAGATVLHAIADNAASALAHPLRVEPRDAPVIAWRWKIAGLLADADSRRASREDAPARIVLEFDGDTRKLPLVERGIYGVARRVAGRDLPYATLMYIWSNRERVGTVIPNPRTRRIEMIVASSGAEGVGAWQSLVRNVRADFVRAFGEEPGTLTAIGVLTDSDNTDAHAEAWYGDIRLEPAAH